MSGVDLQLWVALGNPGASYSATRHNFGFMVAERLVESFRFAGPNSKFHGQCYRGEIADQPILLLLPETFMNRSGASVAEAARFFKITPEQITVWHDDLDLVLGKLRVKRGGGAGGHNGLKDIDARIGQNYRRVRLGISHPGRPEQVHDYVLKPFAKEEEAVRDKVLAASVEAAYLLAKGDDAGFMNKVASITQLPKPKTEIKDSRVKVGTDNGV